jgi:hypothetical protein
MENIWIILGALATIILAILSFIQWKNSQTTLKVKIRKYPFELPSNLLKTLRDIKNEINYPGYSSKQRTEESKNESENYLETLSKQVNKYFFDRFSPLIVEYIQLKNTGNNEIKNIKISVDDLVYFLPDDNNWVMQNNSVLIPLIQPNETIDLKIWSSSIRNDTSIVMSKGRATIVTYKMVPTIIADIYNIIRGYDEFSG